MTIRIEEHEFITKGKNLYQDRTNNKYYRLFGTGISPNACWIVNPVMIELADIDVATGRDILGEHIIRFDICGTVPGNLEYKLHTGGI